MRRLSRLLAILVAVLLLTSANVSQARASGIAITYSSSFTAHFNPGGFVIEQQTTDINNAVVNPSTDTPKTLWDVDDLRQFMASGSMDAGQSFSIDVPAILDNGGHFLVVQGSAGSKGGTLSLSVPELGYSYSRAIGRDGDRWCMAGPFYDLADPQLQPIAGSNGGVGIPATYRWTITATANVHSAGLNAQVFYGSLAQQDALCGGHTWTGAGLLAIIGP